MKKVTTPDPLNHIHSSFLVDRLTALWALNEAGLGGILHALQSPFTGIFVGGIAIILIALIAYFAEQKMTALVKATLIVLIIKALVSPHSPLPAYLAVSFQAIAGIFLFNLIPSHRLAALLLGITGLLESAFQKIITLTLLYGTSLWKSIDLFFDYILQQFGLLGQMSSAHASWGLILIYMLLYLISGILIGYLAGLLPLELNRAGYSLDLCVLKQEIALFKASGTDVRPTRPFWKKRLFSITAVLFVIVLIFTILDPDFKGASKALYVLIRTGIVLMIWYFLLAPFLAWLLRKYLHKQRIFYAADVERVLIIMPKLKNISRLIWKRSAYLPFFRRWKNFLILLILYTLTFEMADETSETDKK